MNSFFGRGEPSRTSMRNKIERNWREAGRELGEGTAPAAGSAAGAVCVGRRYLLASGVGGVVGQAPGVMYSK